MMTTNNDKQLLGKPLSEFDSMADLVRFAQEFDKAYPPQRCYDGADKLVRDCNWLALCDLVEEAHYDIR